MPEVLHLTPADIRRRPWKNGRGVTEELALWPQGADLERGDFTWRISRARIDESGPFSSFPGFERVLVVTDGAGLTLSAVPDRADSADAAPKERAWYRTVRPLEPCRFPGEWSTTAELSAGRVGDFNVIARRGVVEPEVSVLRLGGRRAREPLEAAHAFAHVLGGSAVARVTGEEQAFELAPGDSLWARGLRGGEELDLTGRSGDTVVLLARLRL